jgi:hypothetical protein
VENYLDGWFDDEFHPGDTEETYNMRNGHPEGTPITKDLLAHTPSGIY